ncbi:N-acetylglucosaminyl-diphospho-decaprenol L-rhamnosyltransferase [Lacunisphaera limnophila]|uniref:N-acetylglucosaminyl-diphospho-decaprenol L-rhamnosyltransferase n=1 Tax=Lacunisphaera limnophila TaxID=1838286 RepID=A0A1D8AUJ5_9BACT|nr:glycosyltransferase family 2 protein [Lacunisphaera limnophila]AOS44553.1 N-acetylglucosaminyl-diphospho-decaprenol L-rhamnosyltransferase [Lacunisphaera limnophila]
MNPDHQLCAVVVLYHPEPDVGENLRALVRECGRVVVADNGCPVDLRDRLEALPGVTWLPMDGNVGVATALNRGLAWARSQGLAWALTFDQDSRPEPGMVAALWRTAQAQPAAAVICPRVHEAGSVPANYRWVRRHPVLPGLFQRVACTGPDLPEVTMAVTSGSLFDLAAWDQLGRFDDGFFIDYIDTDYCLRVIRAGRTVAVAGGAVLQHRLGARQARVVLGRDFRPMNHAAFRHYYMARNRVAVWRRHALAVPHWAVFDFCFTWYNLARVLCFESQRGAKVQAILRGTWHGLQGRSGPIA